jgi:SAM-dependent methyltransferase
MFAGASLEVDDLYLLEDFQIEYWPGWVPERELAAVLWNSSTLKHFLVHKCPPITGFIEDIMAQYGPAQDAAELDVFADKLVWTIADLLVYNKCPEIYDALAFHDWDFREITRLTPLDGRIVIDAGSGTGRVALEAAQTARLVFAVEPVTRLRRFIRGKATQLGLKNLYVLDGFLHELPFSEGYADVLITSHALGWHLEAELTEFERVVKPGGFIIHCPGTAQIESEEAQHQRLISPDWGYAFSYYQEADGEKRKYWKQIP